MLKISVIIPTHNRPRLTARAARTVASQTYRPYEVVIVDNGSSDNSRRDLRDGLEGLPNVRVTTVAAPIGGHAARHVGLSECTGDWVATVDSDDMWHPDKLAEQAKAVGLWSEVFDDLIVVLTGWAWLSSAGNVESLKVPTTYGRASPLAFSNMSAPLINRALLLEIGGFNPPSGGHFHINPDIEFWVRLTSAGSLASVTKVLTYCQAPDGPRDGDRFATREGGQELEAILDRHSSAFRLYPSDHARLMFRAAARYRAAGSSRDANRALLQAMSADLRVTPKWLRTQGAFHVHEAIKRSLLRVHSRRTH